MARLLNKMLLLPPTLFEQLVYDLVVLAGLTNVSWRTPGSDGGRDIEGDFQTIDFSGILRLERWYIECKRYKAAIDWPTLHNKVAHASAYDADYLLLCTTSMLSPSCKDALNAYATRHDKPRVRTWEGPELEVRIQREPTLLLKYGLGADRNDVNHALAPLNNIVAKLVHAAYGEQSIVGVAPASIEAASALAELVERHGKTDPRAFQAVEVIRLRNEDLFEWIDHSGSPGRYIDSYAFRAIVAGLRFLSNNSRVSVSFSDSNSVLIHLVSSGSKSKESFLNAVCTIVNWEWHQLNSDILLTARGV